MRKAIIRKLEELERDHSIKILYAVEAGSRAQGSSSSASDYDVRFIYMHKKEWYLSLDKKKDTIEFKEENLDMSGWELAKTLRLLRKSNISLAEWLQSTIVYKTNNHFAKELLDLYKTAFNTKTAFYHYLQLAKNNWKDLEHKQGRIKLYYYCLKSILACKWIERMKQMPPNDIHQLQSEVNGSNKLHLEISKLINLKASGDNQGEVLPIVDSYIEEELKHLQATGESMPASIYNEREITLTLDSFFRKMLNSYEWKE